MLLEFIPPVDHKINMLLYEIYGFEYYDSESWESLCDYLHYAYPGADGTAVTQDNYGRSRAEFTFKTEEQMIMWMLKYA